MITTNTIDMHYAQQGNLALKTYAPAHLPRPARPSRPSWLRSARERVVFLNLEPMEARRTPSALASYVPHVRRRMTILVCENLVAFSSVRDLMHSRRQRRFFGQRIDGVVYGCGDAAAQPGALDDFERYLWSRHGTRNGRRRMQVSYLYWGDINRASIGRLLRLYQANRGASVRPFMPAYRCMLDRAYGHALAPAPAAPATSFGLRLEKHLAPVQRQTFRRVLDEQLSIPQGIVGKATLRRRAKA